MMPSRSTDEVVIKVSDGQRLIMYSYDTTNDTWTERPDLSSLTTFSNAGLDWVLPDLNVFGISGTLPAIVDTATWQTEIVDFSYNNGHHSSGQWVLSNDKIAYEIYVDRVDRVNHYDYYTTKIAEKSRQSTLRTTWRQPPIAHGICNASSCADYLGYRRASQ